MVELFCTVSSTVARRITHAMLMSRARADLQKIMLSWRVLCCWATAVCKIEAVTVFVYFCTITHRLSHSNTKYDALRTSVRKKSGHSEQLDHASLTRPLFFYHPRKISGLARETMSTSARVTLQVFPTPGQVQISIDS